MTAMTVPADGLGRVGHQQRRWTTTPGYRTAKLAAGTGRHAASSPPKRARRPAERHNDAPPSTGRRRLNNGPYLDIEGLTAVSTSSAAHRGVAPACRRGRATCRRATPWPMLSASGCLTPTVLRRPACCFAEQPTRINRGGLGTLRGERTKPCNYKQDEFNVTGPEEGRARQWVRPIRQFENAASRAAQLLLTSGDERSGRVRERAEKACPLTASSTRGFGLRSSRWPKSIIARACCLPRIVGRSVITVRCWGRGALGPARHRGRRSP